MALAGAALAETRQAESPALAAGTPLPAFSLASTPQATSPPQAEASLTARPGSADFGAQLGAQITTFVRAGVQHAQLHLHPAEMGPIAVQIQLDGAIALVHLSAASAETRQALDQALPLLAGSLRESGLTLAGGGVFEQPRQDPGDARGDDPAPRHGSRSEAREQQATLTRAEHGSTPPRRRGVVDLVA